MFVGKSWRTPGLSDVKVSSVILSIRIIHITYLILQWFQNSVRLSAGY